MTKIIVIEDEPILRSEIRECLVFEDFDVVEAENGKVGIEVIFKQLPDIIICDITMPIMDGLEVLSAVRGDARTAHTPFIFMTARVAEEDVELGMNSGASAYITKPFHLVDLLGVINKVMQGR